MERYTASFVNELRSFVTAIRGKNNITPTGMDGRVPVVMAMAARKSFEEHRPVRLDEIEAANTPAPVRQRA
jgi:myo-inositol 2-dehydrogenase/D-chiro-inositol 1-dehydrogenase